MNIHIQHMLIGVITAMLGAVIHFMKFDYSISTMLVIGGACLFGHALALWQDERKGR